MLSGTRNVTPTGKRCGRGIGEARAERCALTLDLVRDLGEPRLEAAAVTLALLALVRGEQVELGRRLGVQLLANAASQLLENRPQTLDLLVGAGGEALLEVAGPLVDAHLERADEILAEPRPQLGERRGQSASRCSGPWRRQERA